MREVLIFLNPNAEILSAFLKDKLFSPKNVCFDHLLILNLSPKAFYRFQKKTEIAIYPYLK